MVYTKSINQAAPTQPYPAHWLFPGPSVLRTVEETWLHNKDLLASFTPDKHLGGKMLETNVADCAQTLIRRKQVETSLQFPLDLDNAEDCAWLKANPEARIARNPATREPVVVQGTNTSIWVQPKATDRPQLDELPPAGQRAFLTMGLAALSLQQLLGTRTPAKPALDAIFNDAIASQNSYVETILNDRIADLIPKTGPKVQLEAGIYAEVGPDNGGILQLPDLKQAMLDPDCQAGTQALKIGQFHTWPVQDRATAAQKLKGWTEEFPDARVEVQAATNTSYLLCRDCPDLNGRVITPKTAVEMDV